jgi:hypothetical protein
MGDGLSVKCASMSRHKRGIIIDESTTPDRPAVALAPPVLPVDPLEMLSAKPWARIRLVIENGVRGWVLERLEFHGGQPRIVRVHDIDRRDMTLGHMLREMELTS